MASFLEQRRNAAMDVADGYGWEEALEGEEGMKELLKDLLHLIVYTSDTPFKFLADCLGSVADDLDEEVYNTLPAMCLNELAKDAYDEQNWMTKFEKMMQDKEA